MRQILVGYVAIGATLYLVAVALCAVENTYRKVADKHGATTALVEIVLASILFVLIWPVFVVRAVLP